MSPTGLVGSRGRCWPFTGLPSRPGNTYHSDWIAPILRTYQRACSSSTATISALMGICRPVPFFVLARPTVSIELSSAMLDQRSDLISPLRIPVDSAMRSEEHTSELQSRQYLVCRLLLE